MYTHLCQDGIDRLTLRQGKFRVMVVGENVAKQQRHLDLRESGHAGVHDPHPSPRCGPSKVLPKNAKQLADSLLIKSRGLCPPLGELTLLAFLQD